MKFSIAKYKVEDIIIQADSLVEQKSTSILFSNILIEAADNKVIFSSSDAQTFFKGYEETDIIEEGFILVNSKKLADIIKVIPETEIFFESDDSDSLFIYSASNTFKFLIKGTKSDKFRMAIDIDEEKLIPCDINLLKNMLQKVLFSTADENDRQYSLLGVLFERKDGFFNLIATNKRKLAFVSQFKEAPTDTSIVPKKVLNQLLRIKTLKDSIQLGIEDRRIVFKINNIVLMTTLLEPKFPDYIKLFEGNFPYIAKINRELLINNIKMLTPLFDTVDDTIVFKFEKNKLYLATLESDMGKVQDVIDIEYDNEPQEILISYRNINDFLKSIESENILFQINEEKRNILIVPEKQDSTLFEYRFITVPVKL